MGFCMSFFGVSCFVVMVVVVVHLRLFFAIPFCSSFLQLLFANPFCNSFLQCLFAAPVYNSFVQLLFAALGFDSSLQYVLRLLFATLFTAPV